MKPILLRLHRWMTLIFAVPLAVVLVTGLILSLEPIAYDRAVTGRSVSIAEIEAALQRHDPQGKATSIAIRAYEGSAVVSQGRGAKGVRIELATGEAIPPDRRLWSDVMTTSRRLHESLLLDLKWLVDASTIAMLMSMVLGLLMGWPFFRNTLGGWHRTVAWGLLPLLLLSPLSGLAIAYGITFSPPGGRVEGPPVGLREAVRLVAAKHDLANVIWIRPQGGAMRARLYDGGRATVVTVTKGGLVAGGANWPRILHEGVWARAWSGMINVVTSIALIGLMTTGLLIWARRRLRRRPVRERPLAA